MCDFNFYIVNRFLYVYEKRWFVGILYKFDNILEEEEDDDLWRRCMKYICNRDNCVNLWFFWVNM